MVPAWLKAYFHSAPNNQLSYAKFIALCLYEPQHGYYMKPRKKLGKQGDFYTSPYVHAVFAEVVADHVFTHIQAHKLPAQILEWGAGDGQFAEHFLTYWESCYETLFPLSYSIIETSSYHRQLLAERFSNKTNVRIAQSLSHLKEHYPSYEGIILSNELFDAFPVHVVQQIDNKLYEIQVAIQEDKLVEVVVPCTNKQLLHWLHTYYPPLKNGQRLELSLGVESWYKEVTEWLSVGFIYSFDYGYTNAELWEPQHFNGSLRGYYQHKLIPNPLCHPGDMDLTHHIHFDTLQRVGSSFGLQSEPWLSQRQFLLVNGILNKVVSQLNADPFSKGAKRNRAIHSFLTGGFSDSFRLLIQSKLP
ncbi:class I SAM-dependent methyltransferase [Halalkalibacterium ligniniphilum]|uniref:class I SAM-dependent methyltransferase n=1 Tax=Halalkalibacterium ligniniphilum TaxID=1134413 RepID=UPI00034D4CFD|nr:SAM-dependent methyltransferase [Halalkalibacterium ligniniphilum]